MAAIKAGVQVLETAELDGEDIGTIEEAQQRRSSSSRLEELSDEANSKSRSDRQRLFGAVSNGEAIRHQIET